MRHHSEETPHTIQARALLHDIESAPTTALPRRATLVAWLNAYLDRASRKDYVTDEAEAGDLIAMEQFLRSCAVPVTGESVP